MEKRMEAAAKVKDLNMQKLEVDVGGGGMPFHEALAALAAPGSGGPGALAIIGQRLCGRGRLTALRSSNIAAHMQMSALTRQTRCTLITGSGIWTRQSSLTWSASRGQA